MASIAEQGDVQTVASEIRSVDSSFPGHVVTGFCLILAPILAFVGALLPVGIYHAKGIDFVRGMAAHATRVDLAFNFAVAGTIVLIFAVIGLSRMITRNRPRLGQAGGVIAIVGLCGPLFFNGVYFGGYQLTGASTQAAAGTMIDRAQIIPSIIVNLSGPALVVGFILLAVGAAKSGVLSGWRAAALGLTCLTPVGFISGFIVISAVAFACTAVALVPLGVRTLQDTAVADNAR